MPTVKHTNENKWVNILAIYDGNYQKIYITYLGKEKGEAVEYTYTLLDRFKDDTISMARTTGYTCTAVANLVLDNMFVKKGISPPEFLGDHFNFVNDYLTERDVIYKVSKR